MSRRVRTLIVAGVLFVALFALVLVLPVPYAILSPGPTINTLGSVDGKSVIGIDGRKENSTRGNLNLTTVRENSDGVSAYQAILGWLKSDEVVVPKSAIDPPGTSDKQVQQQNSADFAQSQDSATAAAACYLGYPSTHVEALDVSDSGASRSVLQPHDVIDSVAGTAVTSATSLRAALARTSAGSTIRLAITRGTTRSTVSVRLGAALQGRTGGSLGISAANICPLPFKVDLGLGNQIGGPSAGMMFALGIIDKVGPKDLTGGRFIAGTGTIDDAGAVGPIGGIALKMIAARQAGATLFLAPQGNCDEVRNATPGGLQVVPVSSLSQAVGVLLDTKAGKTVGHC